MISFSVIIPALNEEGKIIPCIRQIWDQNPGAEIIVSDGGSQDCTPALAQEAGARVAISRPGRGLQCNAGAVLASGEVLLFLHADTLLPPQAFAVLETAFADRRVLVGTFRLKFDYPHWFLLLSAHFSRYDSVFTRFGDQGIAIRKSFFAALGGFPDWALFEDVALLQKARRRTRIVSFPAVVTTSARRYRENGAVRQQLFNLWLMIQYLLGVSPHILAEQYKRGSQPQRYRE